MNSRLLPRADAYRLPVRRETHRIRLRVFKSYERDYHILYFVFGKGFVFGNDIRQKFFIYLKLVSSLLESDAEYLLTLYRVGFIRRVDFYNIVSALAFCF